MKIAFISYEYPPDTAIGGIGTYVFQAAHLLQKKGLDIHVFCGSAHREGKTLENGICIHRIKCGSREQLRELVIPFLKSEHNLKAFHIIEAPEYGAEALNVKHVLPGVPLIVKLHTPKYLIKQLNGHYRKGEIKNRLKKLAGLTYKFYKDPEYISAISADAIVSPSMSLGEIITHDWKLTRQVDHLPNPYIPNQELLSIPPGTSNRRFGYTGRLEVRKGVYNLGKAIPLILEKVPDCECWLIGSDSRGPRGEQSMKAVISTEFKKFAHRIRFIDHVPLSEMPALIAKLDICVYPSLWENFPNVCLEAMTAARGIVASSRGGMNDMLGDIKGGLFADPDRPDEIAAAVIKLLTNDTERIQMGIRCREKVINYYSTRVVDDMISYYNSLMVEDLS